MKALVYKLVEGDTLARHEAGLRDAILSSTGGFLKQPSFSLNPDSGCIKYFDRPLIWRESNRPAGKVPTKIRQVEKIARDFFIQVNRKVVQYRGRTATKKSDLPDPFPIGHLQHVSSAPMLRAGDIAPDHWLSTWMLHLPAFEPEVHSHDDEEDAAPVYGAVVDVRVGVNNQIVGLVSSLPLWSDSFSVDAFAGQSHDHPPTRRDEKGRRIPTSCFVLDSPLTRQQFLAPFRTNAEAAGHHHSAAVLPTCIYSLVVEIAARHEPAKARAELFALIMVHTGEFVPVVDLDEWSIQWCHQRFDNSFDSKQIETTGATLTIDQPGVFHVEVSVKHRATGAGRTTYQQVIVASDTESEQELLV